MEFFAHSSPSWFCPAPVSPQIILCFSPVGHTLRSRARKFPALVNCTAVDWFHAWPQEALVTVSRRFIEETKGTEVCCVSLQSLSLSKHSCTRTLWPKSSVNNFQNTPCSRKLSLFKMIISSLWVYILWNIVTGLLVFSRDVYTHTQHAIKFLLIQGLTKGQDHHLLES